MAREVGAYGLIVGDQAGGLEWWNPAAPSWTHWRFEWVPEPDGERPGQHIDDQKALLWNQPAGWAVITANGSTSLVLPTDPGAAGLVHPYCGSTAIMHAFWRGWHTFHAGSFVHEGKVWAVLGDRESGKSSALAWLRTRGQAIFADDLLVLREGTALAGPRSLDLREATAARFGEGEDLGVVGTRRRWRVLLPPVEPELPFGGWVALDWADTVGVTRPAVDERMQRLIPSRGLTVEDPDPASWLALLALPMFVLQRPADWAHLDTAMGRLLEALP